MIFGSNKRKKEQDVIQAMLQAEDDAFHRTLVSLERLESHLLPNGQVYPQLKHTAAGTSRDHHDNSMPVAHESMYYLELSLDCKALYMCAHYDNPEVFKIAVEAFMKDLLEWYGGRNLLDFYDAVDTAIIPLMVAVSYKSNQIDDLFDKYVYETPIIANDTTEEKYQAVNEGLNAWLRGGHIYEHETQNANPNPEADLTTSHYRGSALDGYKRIVAALSYVCDTSAPLKMFVKMVNEYLPDVASQLPGINEDAIDQMYDQRNNPQPHHQEEPVSMPIAEPTAEPFDIEFDWENNLSEIQPRAVKSDVNSEKAEGQSMESKDSNPSKEEKYARIRVLANEILDLVKSLEEDK